MRLESSLAAAKADRYAFLGDFIDAGKRVAEPNDLAVLARVRRLMETGDAVAVMGNHELNAVLFHTIGADGNPLRVHSKKNKAQHASFLAAVHADQSLIDEWRVFFLDLPLWLEIDGLRLVHACWDQDAIDLVAARRPDGRLKAEDLPEVAAKTSDFARAVETLTTGPEIPLPEGFVFHDFHGVPRHHVRLAWWKGGKSSWRESVLSVPDLHQLPEGRIEDAPGLPRFEPNSGPVLVGHYKMTGAPRIEDMQAACLDYPSTPCAYLWKGESHLMNERLLLPKFTVQM